jgi:hypothetical protein
MRIDAEIGELAGIAQPLPDAVGTGCGEGWPDSLSLCVSAQQQTSIFGMAVLQRRRLSSQKGP